MRPLLLLPLLALACAPDPEPVATEAVLAVTDAFARPAPEGGTTALYFDLVNTTDQPDTLVAVRVAGATETQIHRTIDRGDGMMGMEPIDTIPVPAGETVPLAPGGLHVMGLQLARALAEGDTLDATLEFAVRGPLPVRVPVRLLE